MNHTLSEILYTRALSDRQRGIARGIAGPSERASETELVDVCDVERRSRPHEDPAAPAKHVERKPMHGVAYAGDAGLADAFGARRGAFALRRVRRLKRPVRPVSSLRVRRCEVVGLRRQLNPGRGRSEPPTQQGDLASPPTGCEAQPHLGAAVAEQADALVCESGVEV